MKYEAYIIQSKLNVVVYHEQQHNSKQIQWFFVRATISSWLLLALVLEDGRFTVYPICSNCRNRISSQRNAQIAIAFAKVTFYYHDLHSPSIIFDQCGSANKILKSNASRQTMRLNTLIIPANRFIAQALQNGLSWPHMF